MFRTCCALAPVVEVPFGADQAAFSVVDQTVALWDAAAVPVEQVSLLARRAERRGTRRAVRCCGVAVDTSPVNNHCCSAGNRVVVP